MQNAHKKAVVIVRIVAPFCPGALAVLWLIRSVRLKSLPCVQLSGTKVTNFTGSWQWRLMVLTGVPAVRPSKTVFLSTVSTSFWWAITPFSTYRSVAGSPGDVMMLS